MQIKTTMSYLLVPVRMTYQKDNKYQVLVRMWKKETLVHCWWECKLVQPLWKTVVFHKLKIEPPYDPAISTYGYLFKENENTN